MHHPTTVSVDMQCSRFSHIPLEVLENKIMNAICSERFGVIRKEFEGNCIQFAHVYLSDTNGHTPVQIFSLVRFLPDGTPVEVEAVSFSHVEVYESLPTLQMHVDPVTDVQIAMCTMLVNQVLCYTHDGNSDVVDT
jgi:hypothetical protein